MCFTNEALEKNAYISGVVGKRTVIFRLICMEGQVLSGEFWKVNWTKQCKVMEHLIKANKKESSGNPSK